MRRRKKMGSRKRKGKKMCTGRGYEEKEEEEDTQFPFLSLS